MLAIAIFNVLHMLAIAIFNDLLSYGQKLES